ncbi:MAG: class I SAM-dependent methyltransferase [Tuberibacillus sp.]
MKTFDDIIRTLDAILNGLEDEHIPYCLLDSLALKLQGVECNVRNINILLQWDAFEKAAEHFGGMIERRGGQGSFTCLIDGTEAVFTCEYNTVVLTDPDRISVEYNHKSYWVKSWDYYLRRLDQDSPMRETIKAHLRALQAESTKAADEAWNSGAYEAWLNRFGSPAEWAKRIESDPHTRIASLLPYIEDVKGKQIINLLGSHGTKAIAMGVLGADITVVDISKENANYAKEVAESIGIPLRYIVSDVLTIPEEDLLQDYDLAFMELGILHYFIDLEPLAEVIRGLLKPGGRVIVQDFHPVSTKLITSTGKKHKITGNYFNKSLIATDVAFSKYEGSQAGPKKVYERKWTLGEIVNAFADAGLFICRLDEHPNIKRSDIGIPKTFTLVAEKKAF